MFLSDFKGDLITVHDAGYEAAVTRWAANARREAKVVAFVKDAQDVAIALKYAKDNKLPIAVRGGGHSPVGSSSIEGGLVIDLSRYLNGCKIDDEKKLAFVGGGAIWETVDKAAIEYGLATVAGTVNHTGVAGLTLGGGYGYLTGQHGHVIDNLVQATVVIADGSILIANDHENQDLFFGIRGGGSNFGVVTELVLRLHPQRRNVYAGNVILPATEEMLEQLVKVTQEWEKRMTAQEWVRHTLTVGPDGKPRILVLLFYNGSESEGRNKFKLILGLGPLLDDTREIPYEQLNALLNDVFFHGQYMYWRTTSQKSPHYETAAKLLTEVDRIASETTLKPSIMFEYHHVGKLMSVPTSSTPFRRQPTHTVICSFRWDKDTPGNLDIARESSAKFIEIVKEGQPGVTESQSLGYSNADSELVMDDMKARQVFGEHYVKLQEIKKKYDPEQMFNRWFPIIPAA